MVIAFMISFIALILLGVSEVTLSSPQSVNKLVKTSVISFNNSYKQKKYDWISTNSL